MYDVELLSFSIKEINKSKINFVYYIILYVLQWCGGGSGVGVGRGGGCLTSYKTVKKIIYFCEKGPFKLVSCFYYYFRCFDEK